MGIGKTEPPEYPTFFCKTVNTVIGPGQAIVIPSRDQPGGLRGGARRSDRQTGEACGSSARAGFRSGVHHLQRRQCEDYEKRTSQWIIGKSFDTFGPIGPALVTADEIPDPHGLELSLTLNGQEMQRTNTGNMIFAIPFVIAYLSAVMTLEPGDVISTGTPAKTELA